MGQPIEARIKVIVETSQALASAKLGAVLCNWGLL